ncbi:NAD-dependent histone deacetylase Sir2 [Galdieria sulphuraria]|nr:NAD-dependent histone deacetylase Sir2 [Galdieria sulphuraria]
MSSPKRLWKRFKQDNLQQDKTEEELAYDSNWLDCDKAESFQSNCPLASNNQAPRMEQEEDKSDTLEDTGDQSGEQIDDYENTDKSESESSSVEMAIEAFIEEHSNSLENLRESLMDIGILVSLEQLEQLQSEDIAALIRNSIYKEPLLTYRTKSEDLKNIQDLARIIKQASHILVVSGAGISVSCGIPDFRSAGGIYERIQKTFSLFDPQEIFDLNVFKESPELFYSFAKEIIPRESTEPSLSHRFIRDLECHQKLLRNYAQNIDGLESIAGIDRVVYCHGSFSAAHCLRCNAHYSLDDIRPDIVTGRVPYCSFCGNRVNWDTNIHESSNNPSSEYKSCIDNNSSTDGEDEDRITPNIIKPDIVFFGEALSDQFFDCFESDRETADLLLVIGTSLQVAPVSKIPFCISAEIPQVLINLEPVGPSDWFDLELIGPCDVIIERLYQLLGWQHGMNHVGCFKEEQVQPRRFAFQRDIK